MLIHHNYLDLIFLQYNNRNIFQIYFQFLKKEHNIIPFIIKKKLKKLKKLNILLFNFTDSAAFCTVVPSNGIIIL